MTQPLIHVSEEDLILHFYGESDTTAVDEHLASCSRCRDEFARLRDVLTMVDGADVFAPAETPGAAFEREVWARLEPQLTTPRRGWADWLRPGRLALAAGVATLLVAAFFAGRVTRDDAPGATTSTVADTGPTVAERVLVVAVVDHLDRSQMVLLELLNAEVAGGGAMRVDQSRARELVAASRLYRQTALQTGDESTGDVLDELERTLLEIANTPTDASRDEVDALRARIASRGLLFKVRVVQSEMLERERKTMLPGSQS